jgi:hypothetical protein
LTASSKTCGIAAFNLMTRKIVRFQPPPRDAAPTLGATFRHV